LLQVLVKDNNIDYALKTLKRKMQREGVFRALKVKRFHEKPSEKKLRKIEEAQKRRRKVQYKFDVDLTHMKD
jgi:small subunit ribosomal protein S21